MGIEQYDEIKIKEQLGKPESIGLFFKDSAETVIIEEGPTQAQTTTIGNTGIYGHPVNGILGTSICGESARVTSILAVVNPNKIFYENFMNNDFKDAGFTTTSTWNDNSATFNGSGGTAQSKAVALNDGDIIRATLTFEGSGSTSILSPYMAVGNTASFVSVTNAEETIFATGGTSLYWKITKPIGGTAYITKVTINYG